MTGGLWTLLVTRGIEPSNIAAERALCKSIVQRMISHAVHSASSTIYRYRLFTFTTTRKQHGRDVWQLLEQEWVAHHRNEVMPSLLANP